MLAQLPKWLRAAILSWHTIYPEYKKCLNFHSGTFFTQAFSLIKQITA
jgi:hypothetical protein